MRHHPGCSRTSPRTGCALALSVAAAAVPLALTSYATAATDTYSGPNGNWSDSTKWSLPHPPFLGDDASLTNGPTGGFGSITVVYDVNAPNLNSLTIQGTNGGSVTLLQTGNSLNVAGSEYLGFTPGGSGALFLSGGTHTLGALSGLFLGYSAGATGTVTLSGGASLTSPSEEVIGSSGTGTFNQMGGTNSSGNIFVGYSADGTCTYNLSGGILIADKVLVSYGGNHGDTFTHTGGTNNLSILVLGGFSFASRGTYSLSGAGVLSVTGAVYIGDNGSGTFGQTGGTATLGNVFVSSFGPGTNSISAGVQTVTGSEYVGFNGAGTLLLSGGTHSVTGAGSNGLFLGANPGSIGSATLSGTATLNVVSTEYVGYGSTGTFDQTGGTNSAGSLSIGLSAANATASGAYTLGGAKSTLTVGANATVGDSGAGTFTQTGGSAQVGANLFLGNSAPGRGTGFLSGGSLSVAGAELVGYQGTGAFTQSGGSNTTSSVYVGNYGTSVGTVNLSGGTFSATDGEVVAYGESSAGTFNQSGGTNSVGTQGLVVGYGGSATGAFNLSGGKLSVAGNEVVGNFASGTFTQSGNPVHSVSGTCTVSANPPFSNGTFNLQGGSFTSGLVQVNPGGTFNQTGGSLTGNLNNQGTYAYGGGTFNSRLINQGTFTLNADPTLGNGLDNRAPVTLSAPRTLTLNGLGLSNTGQLTLAGGTLAGNGVLTNNGLMSGFGTIAGTGGFVNNAIFTQGGGNVVLSNTGPNANFGSITLSAGNQFQLTGSGLTNNGTIDLNSTLLAGPARLTNASVGTVRGPGTITSPLTNAGTLLAPSGTLNVVPAFTNTGTIQVAFAASLAGGAINNAGTLQGAGTVANSVTNSSTGSIEPVGGTLTLGAPMPLNSGLLSATTGNKLLMTAGLGTNAGTINLTGGTFDNGAHALANTGQMSGYGTFRTSSLTNAAGGKVTLTGGVATINGDFNNAPGGDVKVLYNPAIFTGNVTNAGTVKITSTTVTFAGSFNNTGTYVSDPADNRFAALSVGITGALVGGDGDRFFITGDLANASALPAAWSTRDAELHFTGSPSHTLTTPGVDRGNSFDGYDANFAWGVLELAPGESLAVADADATTGAALYVRDLLLDGGLAQLPLLSAASPDVTIYYDATSAANAYLDGRNYALAGGGSLVAVPEPSCAAVLFSIAPLALVARRRKPLRRPGPPP